MKTLTTILCAASFSSIAATGSVDREPRSSVTRHAFSADVGHAWGRVRSIADDGTSLVLRTTDARRRTFRLDADTIYVLEGQVVVRDVALEVGRCGSITHFGELASIVELTIGNE